MYGRVGRFFFEIQTSFHVRKISINICFDFWSSSLLEIFFNCVNYFLFFFVLVWLFGVIPFWDEKIKHIFGIILNFFLHFMYEFLQKGKLPIFWDVSFVTFWNYAFLRALASVPFWAYIKNNWNRFLDLRKYMTKLRACQNSKK